MNKHVVRFVLIMFCIPALWYLLQPGFFVTDDGSWMVIRFSAFYQELRAGQFPVRWLNRLNNGYGYPVATFLYPGFMYAAVIPKVLGMSFVWAVKLVLIGSLLAGTVGMYRWLRLQVSPVAAVTGAFLYLYHPYLMWDVYTRGSVGEVLALGVVPWILWGIKKRDAPMTGILYGVLLVSHNTLALLFFPMLLIYQYGITKGGVSMFRTIWLVSRSVLPGIGLAAFFWLPAMMEINHTAFSDIVVSEWQSYSIDAENIGLTGYLHMVIAGIGILLLLMKRLYRSFELVSMLVLICIGLLLSHTIAAPLWETIPLPKLVQFPFRFLAYVVIGVPIVGATMIDQVVPRIWGKTGVGLIIVLAGIGLSYHYLVPAEQTHHADEYYATNQDTTTVRQEYMPTWVQSTIPPYTADRIIQRNAGTYEINTIYWPGFEVYAGDEQVPVSYNNDFGLMRVQTTEPKASLRIIFRETPLRLIADGISLFSGIVLGLWWDRRLGKRVF